MTTRKRIGPRTTPEGVATVDGDAARRQLPTNSISDGEDPVGRYRAFFADFKTQVALATGHQDAGFDMRVAEVSGVAPLDWFGANLAKSEIS